MRGHGSQPTGRIPLFGRRGRPSVRALTNTDRDGKSRFPARPASCNHPNSRVGQTASPNRAPAGGCRPTSIDARRQPRRRPPGRLSGLWCALWLAVCASSWRLAREQPPRPTARRDRAAAPGELVTATRRGAHSILAELRDRCRTTPQADACEHMIRYLSRVQKRKGDTIDHTVRELAAGVGKPVEGLTTRQIRSLYWTGMRNTLRYLTEWGYVDAREALYETNREGRCIVITLHAGVAQSVQATRFRGTGVRVGRGRVRSKNLAPSCTPSAGPLRGRGLLPLCSSERLKAAGRASAPSTRDRAALRASVRAALETEARARGTEDVTGQSVLEACPELAAAPLEVVAREAWRLFGHGNGRLADRPCPSSAIGMAKELELRGAQLERTGYNGLSGRAAPIAALIDLAGGDWTWHWPARRSASGDDKPPATVGGLVFCLRHLARREVAGWRQRRDPDREGRRQQWATTRRSAAAKPKEPDRA